MAIKTKLEEKCGRTFSQPPMRAVTCYCELPKGHGGDHLGHDKHGKQITWS